MSFTIDIQKRKKEGQNFSLTYDKNNLNVTRLGLEIKKKKIKKIVQNNAGLNVNYSINKFREFQVK